jgi:integrase
MSQIVNNTPEGFHAWVVEERGRDKGTADLYVRYLRQSLSHPKGILGRISDKSLAPKTRHTIRAALKAWALFVDDKDLERRLKILKLPAAHRVSERVPIESRDDWYAIIDAVEDADYLPEYVRPCLGIIVIRGIRVGDVARTSKRDIEAAVRNGAITIETKNKQNSTFTVEPFQWCVDELATAQGKWRRIRDLLSPGAHPDLRQKAACEKMRRWLRVVADKAGVDIEPEQIYPHRFRRTYATQFLKEAKKTGHGLEDLQKHMQWKSLETAAGYVDHDEREALDRVASGLRRPQKNRKKSRKRQR